jgi:hypothetical protein
MEDMCEWVIFLPEIVTVLALNYTAWELSEV